MSGMVFAQLATAGESLRGQTGQSGGEGWASGSFGASRFLVSRR